MLPVAAAMAHIESLIVAFASHLCKGYVGGGNVCAKGYSIETNRFKSSITRQIELGNHFQRNKEIKLTSI